MTFPVERFDGLRERFGGAPTEEVLRWALSEFHPDIAIASSSARRISFLSP